MALAPEPTKQPLSHDGPQLVVSAAVKEATPKAEVSPAPIAAAVAEVAVASVVTTPEPIVPASTVAIEPEPVLTVEAVPPLSNESGTDLEGLQHLLSAALAAVKGQTSASEQIEDSTLSLSGDTLTVQTTLSKTMLPVIFNAEADRILKAALRTANVGNAKLQLLPGAPAAASAKPKKRVATSGSAAELAQKHPLVQQAIELFSAEISNIIDLRD